MISIHQTMNTARKLYQTKAKIYRLNLQYARLRMLERKQDTRRKIQLGGLIIKAGLQEEPAAVLLGLLLEAKENMRSKENKKIGDKKREHYRLVGDIAFTRESRE